MTKTSPLIRNPIQGQTLSEESLEKAPPMPTEGMRAIASICSQAADMMMVAASFRPSGLGNVVAGNNAALPPPAQQVSGLNADTLAAVAGLAKAATPAPKKEEKTPEKPEKKESKGIEPSKANPPAAAPAKGEPIKVEQPAIKKDADSWWKDVSESFQGLKSGLGDFFTEKDGPKPSNSEGIF